MQLLKRKQIKAKKGNDVLGFAMILPAICILIYSIVVIAQLCLCRQTLEYALYESSRAAVICEDYNTAYTAMDNVAKTTLLSSTFGIEAEDIDVGLTLVAGTSSTPGSTTSSNNIEWEKGAMAECTITIHINKIIDIGGDTMTATAYVMVERPAKIY